MNENRFWSEEELTILKEQYGLVPVKKLAARFNRTTAAITRMTIKKQWARKQPKPVPTYESWLLSRDTERKSRVKSINNKLMGLPS